MGSARREIAFAQRQACQNGNRADYKKHFHPGHQLGSDERRRRSHNQ